MKNLRHYTERDTLLPNRSFNELMELEVDRQYRSLELKLAWSTNKALYGWAND